MPHSVCAEEIADINRQIEASQNERQSNVNQTAQMAEAAIRDTKGIKGFTRPMADYAGAIKRIGGRHETASKSVDALNAKRRQLMGLDPYR